MALGQRLGARLGAPLGGGLGSPIPTITPGTILFSLLAPGSTETTECAGTDFSAVTGQALTSVCTSARIGTKPDGTLVEILANRPVVELVGGELALLNEPSAQNRATQNNDFAQAVWVKSNMTAVKNATGPTGAANSASTLTATAADATVLHTITSGGSTTRNVSVYLKRVTGTGVVELTLNDGVTWVDVTASINDQTYTRMTSTAFPGLALAAPASQKSGIRIRTSGDVVEVAYFQNELGGFATSPIATVASAVNRAVSYATIPNPLSGLTPSKWWFTATATPVGGAWALSGTNRGFLTLGAYGAANTAGLIPGSPGQPQMVVFDATTTSKVHTATSVPASGTHSLVGVNSSGALFLYVDGVLVAVTLSSAGSGVIATQGATNFIGSRSATTAFNGWISDIKIGTGNYPPTPL